jgi:hypothetical protein
METLHRKPGMTPRERESGGGGGEGGGRERETRAGDSDRMPARDRHGGAGGTAAVVCERETRAGGWMRGRLELRETGADRDFEKSIKNLHCCSAVAQRGAAS